MGIPSSSPGGHPSPQVAAYYFPGFHPDPRNERRYGAGWTEWELLRHARPRFPGHHQPRQPLWGYEDESRPAVMERKLSTAAAHGVGVFLFDWYWYDGPFLQRALEEGYLGAASRHQVKFALMWANHNWVELFPRRLGAPEEIIFSGETDPQRFEMLSDYVIERYFRHPNYWTIDGCPYLSIYDLPRFAGGFGGELAGANQAIRRLREKVKAAGFPDLHVNLVCWQENALPGSTVVKVTPQLVRQLGFDSITSYVWIHHVKLGFPTHAYVDADRHTRDYTTATAQAFAREGIPYFPNVTTGWDATPRTHQAGAWSEWEYPFGGCLVGNTPARFQSALEWARRHNDAHPETRGIVTVNAWNEWTEGSYLEPDVVTRYGYLEAIRNVFGALPSSGRPSRDAIGGSETREIRR